MENEPTAALAAGQVSGGTRMYLKAVLCLVAGMAAGYLARGWLSPVSLAQPSANAVQSSAGRAMSGEHTPSLRPLSASSIHPAVNVGVASGPGGAMGGGHVPSLMDMKRMADKQAAPVLERLRSDPNNSALLSQAGAIYHTTHQFKEASAYYNKAVQADPRNVALRTKLASSLYRNGDVDGAIAQIHTGLSYEPNDPNSLFNLGMIKLQGKQDGKGALAAWQQLLKSNPQLSPDRKATVQKLMADVLTTLGDQGGKRRSAEQ